MADGMVYTIRLKLKVDDKEVDNAMRKVDRLNNRTIRARSGVGADSSRALGYGGTNKWNMVGMGLASRYGNVPSSQYRMLDIINYRLARKEGLSNQNFLRNVNNSYGAFGTLKSRFLGNLANPVGLLRNVSNFGAAIGSIGKLAGAAVPALGALGTALGIFAASKGFQMAGNLIPLWIGNKIMQSQGMTEGASNLMQFQMARKGLGSKYEESLQSATKIAGEYGFSRTGILNSINMLTGLNIGKRTLSRQEATHIATQAGKISNLGGVPFERVNINMQQLLGQPTPSARDLRELLQAAPIIGKIAQQSMASKGKSGDIFAYLKDKENLLQVLNDFDKMIESNPFMKARGAIALSKENFFMDIVKNNSDLWPKIAEGIDVFYKKLEPIVGDLLKRLSQSLNSADIAKSMEDLRTTLKGLSWILKAIANVFNGFMKPIDLVLSSLEPMAVRAATLQTLWKGGQSGVVRYKAFEVGAQGTIEDKQSGWSFGLSMGKQQEMRDNFNTAARTAKIQELINQGISKKEFGKYLNDDRYWKPHYSKNNVFPFFYEFNKDGVETIDPLSQATNATDELADVTKGQKSLIINFNREIVNMPVNIDTVNDGSDLVSRLNSLLPDMIVRGMSIALNNATGAI